MRLRVVFGVGDIVIALLVEALLRAGCVGSASLSRVCYHLSTPPIAQRVLLEITSNLVEHLIVCYYRTCECLSMF